MSIQGYINNDPLTSLPEEMLGEISNLTDSKTEVNLSLVSKKIRQSILENAQQRNIGRRVFIDKKIELIRRESGKKELERDTEQVVGVFKVAKCRYEYLAKERNASPAIEPNSSFDSYSYVDSDSYIAGIISLADSVPKDKRLLDYLINQAESLISYPDGASKILKYATQWAESLPLSGEQPQIEMDRHEFKIIPNSYYLSMIARLLFRCNDVEEPLKLLALAKQKAKEETDDLLLLCPTLTHIADIYFQIGHQKEGLELLAEAKNKAMQITESNEALHILLGFSKLFHKYTEDSLAFDTLHEAITKANTIKGLLSRLVKFQDIHHIGREFTTAPNRLQNFIFELKQAAMQNWNSFQANGKKIEEEPYDESDCVDCIGDLYSSLVRTECRLQNFDDALKTADLLEKWGRDNCLVDIGESLINNGFCDKGKILLTQVILSIIENPIYNISYFPFLEAIKLLAENNYLDEAVEYAEKLPAALFSTIVELISVEIKKGNLEQALLLLNHFPELHDNKEPYIDPLLKISELIAKKSMPEEIDSLSGSISEAIEFTDLAKTFVGTNTHVLSKIAKAKAKIGDLLRAQRLMLERREDILSHIRKDQQENPDEAVENIIKGNAYSLSTLAMLQTELYDYEGAMDTVEILKVDPDLYIRGLAWIGMRNPKF